MYDSMISITAGLDILAEQVLLLLRYSLGIYGILLIAALTLAAVMREFILTGRYRPRSTNTKKADVSRRRPYRADGIEGERPAAGGLFDLPELLS